MKAKFLKDWSDQSAFSYFSLILALASLLLLCIPFVGYVAILLSGSGLLLASYETYRSLRTNKGHLGFALAGSAACLIASAIAFLPWVSR